MTLVYSGTISLGDIADETGQPRTYVSLRNRSEFAGKGTPDAMSEFWGYTSPAATFSHATQIFGPVETSTTGSITTYKSNVNVSLKCFGGVGTYDQAYAFYTVNGVGSCQTSTATRYQFQYASLTIPTSGSRAATLTLRPNGSTNSSSQYAQVTAS